MNSSESEDLAVKLLEILRQISGAMTNIAPLLAKRAADDTARSEVHRHASNAEAELARLTDEFEAAKQHRLGQTRQLKVEAVIRQLEHIIETRQRLAQDWLKTTESYGTK